MPNWCEGWVKFRGSLEDLKRFIENEFKGAEPEINDEELSPLIEKWNVGRQGYEELAKKYNLDIKGKCYERCMEFVEEFEVNNKGDVVLYEVHKFDDYYWECECPTLGG